MIFVWPVLWRHLWSETEDICKRRKAVRRPVLGETTHINPRLFIRFVRVWTHVVLGVRFYENAMILHGYATDDSVLS